MSIPLKLYALVSSAVLLLGSTGCVHFGGCGGVAGCDPCGQGSCDPCGYDACGHGACGPCGGVGWRPCLGRGCLSRAYSTLSGKLTSADIAACGVIYHRSNAIPETLPLGSTNRAWYQVMQTNAEASDFIIYQMEFVGETATLTPDGKDHVWEIAARMRSTLFPVIIERSTHNANPELDAHRRNVVVAILSTPYSPGYNALEAEPLYYQHLRTGGINQYGTFGNNFGQFGGFGGGGGGGIGFGP